MYRNGSLSKILLDKTLFLKTLIKSTIIGFAAEAVNFSHWMELLPPHLHDVPLTELAIPGSHDSCSYSLSPRAPYSDSLNSVVNEVLTYNEHNYNHFYIAFLLFQIKEVLNLINPAIAKDIVYRWSVTQTQTISQQLASGIRYLDMRIIYLPSKKDM